MKPELVHSTVLYVLLQQVLAIVPILRSFVAFTTLNKK